VAGFKPATPLVSKAAAPVSTIEKMGCLAEFALVYSCSVAAAANPAKPEKLLAADHGSAGGESGDTLPILKMRHSHLFYDPRFSGLPGIDGCLQGVWHEGSKASQSCPTWRRQYWVAV
jgi:hypothetical protein